MTTTPELLALQDFCTRIETAGLAYMWWAQHLGVVELIEEVRHD